MRARCIPPPTMNTLFLVVFASEDGSGHIKTVAPSEQDVGVELRNEPGTNFAQHADDATNGDQLRKGFRK